MRYMLDSSFCIDVMRDKTPRLRARFKAERDDLAVSTVVLHELFYGAANSDDPAHARRKVAEFAAHVTVIDFDGEAASHAGDIRADLRRKGRSIGAYDVLIAAHARSVGAIVVTSNMKEFRRVDGLLAEDWRDEGTS